MASDVGLYELEKIVSDSLHRVAHLVSLEHEQLEATLRTKLQHIQRTSSEDDVYFSEIPSLAQASNSAGFKPSKSTTSWASPALRDGHDTRTSRVVQVVPASPNRHAFQKKLTDSLGSSNKDPSRRELAAASRMSTAGINLLERPEFSESAEKASGSKLLSQMSHLSEGADDDDRDKSSFIHKRTGCRCQPVHPDSGVAGLWDVLSVICIIHDFIAMPLQVFNEDTDSGQTVAEMLVGSYWALNIPVKFFIGYLDENGRAVRSFARVAKKYAKTWLSFDVALVVIDMISLGIESASFRILLALRLLRFLRLVRIFDFLKLISSWIHLHVRSEGLNILFGIMRIVVVMLGVAHLFSCCWYYVGTWHSDVSWPKAYNLEKETLAIRYFTSFHWAIVQYSGDSSIVPQNGSERIAACAVQFVAFVLSAIIVSDLTTIMTQIQVIGAHTNRQILTLKRYLFDKKVSTRLANRIVESARLNLEESKRKPPEHTVEMLMLISGPLRTELHYHMYAPNLKAGIFFARYDGVNLAGMRALCHCAVRLELASEDDLIFSVGELMQDPCLYFVTDKGCLLYQCRTERFIEQGTCINEPVLWISDWMQIGTLKAQTASYVLSVRVLEAVKVMQQYRTKCFYPGRYARQFVKELKAMDIHSISDISSECIDLDALAENVFGSAHEAGSGQGRARKQFNKMLWNRQRSHTTFFK